MAIWHTVISASGIRIVYNPFTLVYGLRFAKPVAISLRESSDFFYITVRRSQSNQLSLPVILTPEQKLLNPNLDGLSLEKVIRSEKMAKGV